MIIVDRPDQKVIPNLSIKLSELVIDQMEGEEKERQNLIANSVEELAKTETAMNSDCTTPTAKENKIPDVMTCPPAPRKRKPTDHNSSSKVRAVKQFLASPALDVIFNIGINQVSSNNSWNTKRKQR